VRVDRKAVVVSSPTPSGKSGSPAAFNAVAQGGKYDSISLYVDGTEQYQAQGSTLNTSLGINNGKHKVQIKGVAGKDEIDTAFPLTVVAPSISIHSPKQNASLYSPVQLVATAQNPDPLVAMQVYVDNQLTYEGTGWGFNFPLEIASAGDHTVVVQSWDANGNVTKKAATVNIIPVTVSITTPQNNQHVSSPVTVKASADGPNVYAMQVYVDNSLQYSTSGNTVNTAIAISSGQHYLLVKAWDTGGGTWTSGVNIVVN
jgi:hypothetical protein